jgi:ABC-type dipeptide/oligopeptide/nickel transport system ATPase component
VLLDIRDLRISFRTAAGDARAVDGVDLQLNAAQTLGLVGESGCGKTVTGLSIMRLVPPPGRITDGRIEFAGRDLRSLPERAMREVRGAEIGMIFRNR